MKHIDAPVPLDARLPNYPNNTPFRLEPIQRVSNGDRSNVATLHMMAHRGTHVESGRYALMCRPRPIVGSDRAPARVVLSRA